MIARGFPTSKYPQWGCFEKDQAEALANYGHKVVVMSVDARFKRHRGMLGMHQFQKNGVEYNNYVMLPGVFFKFMGLGINLKIVRWHYYNKLYKKIFKEHGKPDVIYSHFFWNTYTGILLKEKYNIPVVGIEHLGRFNEPVLPPDTNVLASYAFPKVDKLIAVSNKLCENIKSRFHIDCEVVNNMYGQEFLDIPKESFKQMAQSKSLLTFISVARIDYKKGFDILINAFIQANLPKDSWKLNIIGWGEDIDKLKSLVLEKDLQDNVFLLGKKTKDQIVSELRRSDVFVLASRLETFGLVFVEAMSQGLPVIGTICGGPEEIINENNGILVPSDNIEAMSAAIKKMVETDSQYDRKQIAEDCASRFSPQAIAAKLTDVFENVVKKN